MQKLILAAAGATLAFSAPAAAQSAQEKLDARYDRALAAGYKALFLCSAIANAERSIGYARSAASIYSNELTGIQEPLDAIVGELEYQIERWPGEAATLRRVMVSWSDTTPPRIAVHRVHGGCSLYPIGAPLEQADEQREPRFPEMIASWHVPKNQSATPVLKAAIAGGYGEGTRTTSAMVRWGEHGQDWRFADGFTPYTPQRTWSVAKSIATTLVGAAVHRGDADVNASAGLGGDASDPRRAITIDHALRMASGRYTDTSGNRTNALYYGGATVHESMTHWPLIHAPGTVYRYANNDTLAATQAIRHTFAEHPPAEFFEKVGMHHTVAETDWQGDYILSSQVWSTAQDFATLGQLMLNDGVTESGERVLPEGWVEYVTTPSGPQPDGPLGYGAGWWLVNKSEGVPPDTYAALGNRGQILVVVPSRNVVIVRRGEDPSGSRFDFVSFTRDILAALDD